jgi:hypothetical protein
MALALLAAALFAGAEELQAAFPGAALTEAPGGGRLVHASGFVAAGLGASPEEAARAFLARHGSAFGILPGQELVLRAQPSPGQAGPVRFERRIRGRPVFGGEVVVGVDAEGAVFLVNASDVPPLPSGRFALSRTSAVRAAKASLGQGLELTGLPATLQGWQASGQSLRAAWRVDLVARRPAGEWRVCVDAETGEILLRLDRRRRTFPRRSRPPGRTIRATDGLNRPPPRS